MLQVIRGDLGDPVFCARYAETMFRLRYRVFHERLGWQVPAHDGLEYDEFDDAHARYLLVAAGDTVLGGWRLRPTTQPYMLADVFANLLDGQRAPRHPRIWEVSRFAVDESEPKLAAFGLNAAARTLLSGTAEYALDHGIDQYVMVASAAAERMYRHVGLQVHRFGPPQRIGRVLSVGCWVDIDAHTRQVLLGHPLQAAA